MAGAKIKAIIFDIGRVIIRLDLRRVQTGLSEGLRLSPEELWSAIEKDPQWMDWQDGRISERDCSAVETVLPGTAFEHGQDSRASY